VGALAIGGSAPSVLEHLDDLRAWPGEIWAINGAYDFLLSQGIVAHGFVGLDPVPGLVDYVRNARPETTFFISSVCDPGVFDALSDQHVWLWHSKMADLDYPPDARIVGGGTTCLTRAPFLANMLGWRDMTIFGADSSYGEAGFYCYRHGMFPEDTNKDRILVNVDGTVFETELQMMKQVSQLSAMKDFLNEQIPGQLKFRCGGLLAAFLNSPERPLAEFGEFQPENAA